MPALPASYFLWQMNKIVLQSYLTAFETNRPYATKSYEGFKVFFIKLGKILTIISAPSRMTVGIDDICNDDTWRRHLLDYVLATTRLYPLYAVAFPIPKQKVRPCPLPEGYDMRAFLRAQHVNACKALHCYGKSVRLSVQCRYCVWTNGPIVALCP